MIAGLRWGIYSILTVSFFVLGIKRVMPQVPLGLAMDVMLAVMLLGMFAGRNQVRDWHVGWNPVGAAVLLWIGYCMAQVLNPEAASRLAWLYTVRSMAGLMLLYFVALYSLDTLDALRAVARLWIVLASLAAAYTLVQEFAGLRAFELEWLQADELRSNLFSQDSRIRKFSFLSDPTVLGILLAYTGVFCIGLATGPFRPMRRSLLVMAGATMFWAMLYTGTRTAFVMVPVGLLFICFVTLRRGTVAWVALLAWVFLVAGPLQGPNLTRLRTAYAPAENPSYQVRVKNQAAIQPRIQSTPFGGGLGSTGIWGERFSPHTELARFPPDSGFVRVAVETGWVGLVLYLGLLFTILWQGTRNYFAATDARVRAYAVALLAMLFSLILGSFAQQAITELPTSILFSIVAAALCRLKDYETAR